MKNNNKIYKVYGLNNCFHLLTYNSDYFIKKICIDKSSKINHNKDILDLIDSQNIHADFLDHHTFNKQINYKHSQGIYIEFEGDLYSDLYDLDISKDNTCIIIADQLTDPQNLGQILRTCECAGVDGIILPKHNSIHLTDTVLQVSQGAFIHLNVCIETNLKSSIDYLKSNGFWITGLENSIDAKQWYEMNYNGKIGIVIGSEGKGIRKLIKESCDFLATIDMNGEVNSLNVTAATSVMLFERQRQINSN